jgi:hypothetical protein
MLRRSAFKIALLLLFLPLLSTNTFGQSTDRARLSVEIDSLREQLKIKEREFLAPSPEDHAAFAEFLRQPETGLIRLLPREKYEKKMNTSGGGAFYSFSRLTHEYGRGSDLMLEQNQFRVGFAGADFGYLLLLGDVPLEEVIPETDGVQFLAALATPSKEPEARTQQQHASKGIKNGDFIYQNSIPVQSGKTYVVRSVSYSDSDTLVAFRVVRQEADGSVILLWKMLKKFSTPQLTY